VTAVSAPTFPNLIGGAFAPPQGGWLDVANPARASEIVARVAATTAVEIDRAIEAAATGFEVWRRVSPGARGAVLAGAASWLREHAEEVASLVSAEMGKTLPEARAETARSADFFDYYGSLSRLPEGDRLADGRPGVEAHVRVEPVGMVVAITPWNDPLLTPARKLAPALFAGNAVLIKPATETPVSSLLLARALHEAGLPPGVLNTVTGRAADVISPLCEDKRVDAVTFTGSTEVGLDLQRRLAGRNVRLQTEMGGKNPSVVLADADLDLAAATIAAAAFGQAGQRCTATSRVIVADEVVRPLLDRLVAKAGGIVVGPGDDEATTMGPLVSERQLRSVLGDVERALEQGAERVFGEGRLQQTPLDQGWFVSPVILAAVTRDMDIWNQEVFGPVLAVSTVSSLAEAIDAANDSPYGLAAALFTDSVDASTRFIDSVEAGQVAVNLPTSGWDVHMPFGGWKLSGSGFKEQGLEGLRFYTRVKTVAVKATAPGG